MADLLTAPPGKLTTVVAPGLQSGIDVGFQVIKAATGTVAIGRTEDGVDERPLGSGNWAATFLSPVEDDLYLVVFDWSDGALTPETSFTVELSVSASTSSATTGLGAIADYTRTALGGETWDGLTRSVKYGAPSIMLAIEVIKNRTMTDPPATNNESSLPPVVLSYLGKLTALQLMPAARDWWAMQLVSTSIGNDPVEMSVYPNRDRMLDALESLLLRQVSDDAPLALSLIDGARVNVADNSPDIDEDDTDHYVTDDPRAFPALSEFPLHVHTSNRATIRDRMVGR